MNSGSGLTISKSRYLSGLQCAKRVWTEQHARKLIPETDAATQARFDEGHEVGRLATQLFPGGLEISPGPRRWAEVVTATNKALSQRRPLYEPGFLFDGAACRVDVLVPVDQRRWDVVEVKSSTSVKDLHLEDLAFQAFVLEGAGLEIRDYCLVHIDNSYVRQGEIDITQLFHSEQVTEPVRQRRPSVPAKLELIRAILEQDSRPEVGIGSHCDDPYSCPLKSECWAFLADHSVVELYGGPKKGFELLDSGIVEIRDLPADVPLSAKQQIQVEAVRSGTPFIDRSSIDSFLATLTYPLNFFDIETFAVAVPPFDGVRPYQQVPFLFSIHRVGEPGAEARHFAFQVTSEGDPRPEFMRAVTNSLGAHGSIISYNAAFESRVLVETAAAFPEFQQWSLDATDRFVDLLEPFRAFHFYDPNQHGSASLKSVLPALTGMTYDELKIQKGDEASREYFRVMRPGFDSVERARVLRELEAYCSLDTLGLVAIVECLRTA